MLSDLRSQIASWLNRTDLTSAQLGLFVTAAENDFKDDLQVRESEQVATGTVVSGEFSAPTDYLATRVLTVDGHEYEYLAPGAFAQKQDSDSIGWFYTIEGDVFRVLSGTDYRLTYVAQIAPLVDDDDTNWLLTNAPFVYIWAGCKYGSVFLRDAEAAQGYDTLYKEAAAKLNRTENKARYGGPMMVRRA